jgi:predicted DNA-binding transcriptional regulator AlpA
MDNPAARYESNPAGLKEVLTPEDLAEMLGISVWTIYAKTSKRNREHCAVDLPPFFRMGKLIRFYRKDLISWLESRSCEKAEAQAGPSQLSALGGGTCKSLLSSLSRCAAILLGFLQFGVPSI